MADVDDDCCVAAIAAASVVSAVSILRAASYRKRRQRSVWVRPFERRSQFGAYNADDFDTLLLTIREDIVGLSAF